MQQHQLVQGTVEQMEDTGLHKQVTSLLLQILIIKKHFTIILSHEIKIHRCGIWELCTGGMRTEHKVVCWSWG